LVGLGWVGGCVFEAWQVLAVWSWLLGWLIGFFRREQPKKTADQRGNRLDCPSLVSLHLVWQLRLVLQAKLASVGVCVW